MRRKKKRPNRKNHWISILFELIATKATKWTGSSYGFIFAATIIILWLILGPIFDFSDTWQLVVNTLTTIITFLMVFLIQKSQNKDSLAIQIKLNELVAANEKASNRLIDVEDLTEEELDIIHRFYKRMAHLAKEAGDIHSSHSIDRAEKRHEEKEKSHRKENQKFKKDTE